MFLYNLYTVVIFMISSLVDTESNSPHNCGFVITVMVDFGSLTTLIRLDSLSLSLCRVTENCISSNFNQLVALS